MMRAFSPEIHIDDEFKALIPPLLPDEYAQLETNILAEGCRDALVLWDDVLIDGHNRYSICQKHGLPFRTEQATTIHSYDDAVLWIVNNQLGRRNISDFVRGELALRAKPIIEARAKNRQLASLKHSDSIVPLNSVERGIETRQTIADVAGVSKDTIRKIEKIQEAAAPAILAAVRSGEISINAAQQVADLPLDQQTEIAANGIGEVKKAAAQIRASAPKVDYHAIELESLHAQLSDARESASLLADELEAYRAIETGDHFAKIQQLQEANRILKSQLADYTNQTQQLKKQLKMLQRQAGGQHVG